jgi:hypothetical protein
MTIAEIHGKLRPYESMEDLLTSDVFGTFKYCNPQEGLVPFLEHAVTFDGSKADSAEYFFWPRSKSGREPDVIIILKFQKRGNVAINIEAKYLSGKHNVEVDDTENINMDKFEKQYLVGDQLVDQFLALKGKLYIQKSIYESLKSCEMFYLFYVTSHYIIPDQDVQETKNNDKYGDIKHFYWLNWSQAWKVCRDNSEKKLMLDDLRRLLERKRLTELNLWKDADYSITADPYFWMEEKRFWQIEYQFEQHHDGWFFWHTGN